MTPADHLCEALRLTARSDIALEHRDYAEATAYSSAASAHAAVARALQSSAVAESLVSASLAALEVAH